MYWSRVKSKKAATAVCGPFTWRACLLAEYPVDRGTPARPARLLTVTMLPLPRRVMWGSTFLVMETVPRKFSSIKAWYTSTLVSRHNERWLRPPLLISMSIWKGTEEVDRTRDKESGMLWSGISFILQWMDRILWLDHSYICPWLKETNNKKGAFYGFNIISVI